MEKQKLDIACELLKQALKKASVTEDVNKKYQALALRGSVQSRKNQKTLIRR